MDIVLLTIKSELESAKSLGFPTSVRGDFTGQGMAPEDFDKKLVVRWGNSALFYNRNGRLQEFKNVANPSKAICLNCSKLEARETFGKVVNIPKMYKGTVPAGKVAVVRPFSHAAGSDFKVVTGPFEIPYGCYASEFIETDTEYRVWFAHGRTFAGQRVPLNGESKDKPCRSNWGYSYREVTYKLHTDTLAAAKAIGLTFGAADLLIKGGRNYFLELNSAPSIDAPTPRRFYQEALKAYAIEKGFKV